MKKIIILLFFANVVLVNAQEQPRVCGTKTPSIPYRISSKNMQTFLLKEAQLTAPLCIKLYFTVFAENNGSSRATLDSEIYRQLQNTVNQYAPHGICFVLGGIRQINNSDLNFQDIDTEESELDPYKVAGYLNVFVHLNLVAGQTQLNGTAYDIPNIGAYISLVGSVLDEPNSGNISTMAHELGHVFGLYHTFEKSFGAESVSRTNACKDCELDGDFLCSTPADPDDNNGYLATNTSDCVYSGTRLDECNTPYMPDVSNIMAYGVRVCRNNFTTEQGDRMRYVLANSFLLSFIIAQETYTEVGSQTYSTGVTTGISRDLYRIFPNGGGGNFIINGTANFTLQSKKILINSNTRFSPSNGGRVNLKPNPYCN